MKRSGLLAGAAVAVVAATTGCPSGWRLVRVEGDAIGIRPTMWDEIRCTATQIQRESELGDEVCRAASRPLVHCADPDHPEHRELYRREPGGAARVDDARCKDLQSLVSFIHFSDAQLKEHNIQIRGELSEAQYDGLTNGASRHELLERHDDAVLLATMLAANALQRPDEGLARGFAPCPAPAAPRFAIHTGDAVDSGMFSELLQFLAAAEALDIPFYNVIGNHDNLFFGTFPPEHMKGLNVVVPYVPIVDTDRFMRFHSKTAASSDLSLPMPPNRPDEHDPTRLGCRPSSALACDRAALVAESSFHGFDLACGPTGAPPEALCAEARGYYSFDIDLPPSRRAAAAPRALRIVVLNTAEISPSTVGEGLDRRSKGNMLPEQLRWLRRRLEEPPAGKQTYHLIFGHHNLGSFLHASQERELRSQLVGNPDVLAYIAGHTHVDAFSTHRRPSGGVLWELLAGSTLIYPQLARHVELLDDPGGAVYLRLASFRQKMGDAAARVRRKPAGDKALPEHCQGVPQEGTTYCFRQARRAQLGRFGAMNDVSDVDRRDEHVAVRNANGLIRVHDGRLTGAGR